MIENILFNFLCILNFYGYAIYFAFIVGSEMKDIANSSRPSESASTSPVQNTGLSETSTDDVVTHTSESSTEIVNTSDNSNEAPNVSGKINEHNEIELDSKVEIGASEECVHGQNETRLADAEIDQGNSADNSIESSATQDKVSSSYLLIYMEDITRRCKDINSIFLSDKNNIFTNVSEASE